MSYFTRTPIRYRTILITAGVLATLFLFQAYMHHYVFQDVKEMGVFNWWREAPVPYLNFLFWALLCPLVYSILRRWPFDARPVFRTIALHIGFSLLIATVHEVVTSTLYYTLLQSVGDFDIADDSEGGGISEGRVAKSIVGSFIPFRGIVREVSGANARRDAFNRAVTAGMVRRGYLKGLGQQRLAIQGTKPGITPLRRGLLIISHVHQPAIRCCRPI